MSDLDAELDVSLYGTRIGKLHRTTTGEPLFEWSPEAETRWPLRSRTLSNSLRVGDSSVELTASFFGALLPEGQWLNTLARTVQRSSSDIVGILDQVGADLAGALVIGHDRQRRDPTPVSVDELDRMLQDASGFVIGGGGSALPGFQRKLTLTRVHGRWTAGNGSIPSTHILKPVPVDFRAAIEGENYVLGIGRALGLTTYESWTEDIGQRSVLVIERYDRATTGSTGSTIQRIHQEDLAQALGLPWGGNEKFEAVDSRANLKAIAGVLDEGRTIFSAGESDKLKLLRYSIVNIAVGNTDAHAKNFSILRPETGLPSLAPFYDSAPLALGYDATQTLALRINGVTQQPEVTVENLVNEAESWGVDRDAATEVVADTLDRVIEATYETPAHESIESHVPGYIRQQAMNLAQGKRARVDSHVPLMLLPRIDAEQPTGELPD